MSTVVPDPKQGAGCWKVGLVSCLVLGTLLAVCTFGLVFFMYGKIRNNPNFMEIQNCTKNLIEVRSAIERYHTRNNAYPSDLEQLLPDFLSDSKLLHCAADKSDPHHISYTYMQPPGGAPGSFIVLICNRHRFMNQPVVLRMQKDGNLVAPQYGPKRK